MKRAVCLVLLVAACSHGTSKAAPEPTYTTRPAPVVTDAPTATARPTPEKTRAVVAIGPVGTRVPSGFTPMSATFVSDSTGWVLGSSPCPTGTGRCDVVVRTRDGGRTWRAIPSPRTSPDSLAQIRFADERNGFVTGDQLWSTHDGGASWRVVAGAGETQQVAAAEGRVWVLSGEELGWMDVRGGPRHVVSAGVGSFVVQGQHVAAVVSRPEPQLRYDGAVVRTPCAKGSTPVAGLGSSTHWFLVCEGDAGLGHQDKQAFESFDAGTTWKPAGAPPQLSGSDVYVTSDGSFVFDHQDVAAYRGGSWKVVLSTGGGVTEGGFESARLGYCIGAFGDATTSTMQLTHDAGRSWQDVVF